MTNIDFKKEYKELFAPSAKQFSVVEVPKFNFFMVDGQGDPNNSEQYQQAVEALYSVSYTLRFLIIKQEGKKYTVPPLEGLWWADDMNDWANLSRDEWKWTMMILQPDFATPDQLQTAQEEAAKKSDSPAMQKLRFESFKEGKAAQILYFGPYADEGPTIIRLHEFITEQGFKLSGKHHEIYLSDPRRTAPEKLKTVIRQPMAK